MNQVQHFFDNHPGHDKVYESLGMLFIKEEDAIGYVAGATGQLVITHERALAENDGEVQANETGQETDEQVEQEVVTVIEETEKPPVILHDDATTFGKTAEELDQEKKDADTKKAADKKAAVKKEKEPKKESAKKAAANSKPSGKSK